MLLIGDLHLNIKIIDKLLNELENKIFKTNSKNIIFVGDYLYHFVYDKYVILKFFEFLLKLIKNDKKVYILAGNHDWINGTFIFEEVNLLLKHFGYNKIIFITSPIIETIEGKKILFLPNNPLLNWEQVYNEFGLEFNYFKDKNLFPNDFIKKFLRKNRVDFVIHHWYTKNLGYKEKDGAIDTNGSFFINGHIHQIYYDRTNLCIGNVWAVSSSEANQLKFIFEIDDTIKAYSINIKNYITIELSKLDKDIIFNKIQEFFFEFKKNNNKIDFVDFDFTFNNIILYIIGDFTEEEIKKNKEIFGIFKEVKIKSKKIMENQNFLNLNFKPDDIQKNRKIVLIEMLKEKYKDKYILYEDILKEIGIL